MRRKRIISAMRPYFKSDEKTACYVDANLERKQRNLICRRIRMARKANLANFNYFCTFTYDSNKHTEETFKKNSKQTVVTCLPSRLEIYGGMGAFARKTKVAFSRVILYPRRKMIGKVERYDDYSVRLKRVQTTYQNSYFNEKFGRSDFELIDDKSKLGDAMAYLMKYIEKTGERIVYSKGLYQYFISDIMDEDIISTIGMEDKKLLLYDDFKCWDEGCLIGNVSEEAIKQMRKSN